MELETDNSEVVQIFNNNSEALVGYTLASTFQELCTRDSVFRVGHICRDQNCIADRLIVMGRGAPIGSTFFADPPDETITLLHKEKNLLKKKEVTLASVTFYANGLPDGAELAYFIKGQTFTLTYLEGYKQGNGIVCECCERELSPSQFEAHAGLADRRRPYHNIYTSNGLTLHDIALSLANGQRITIGCSNDICAICGNSGDLLLCHECHLAFHTACLKIEHLPEDDWLCANCSDKKGLGRKDASGEASRIVRPIVIRLTRVVKAPEFEIGGCAVCRLGTSVFFSYHSGILSLSISIFLEYELHCVINPPMDSFV
ncbi:uncharacterized protein LOC120214103 [Hibiscus syriacus]|uniref:uncharacterized protein LOC120214103 n=1 Tax=Hibiscus syriacus TaxID=106335 RepID=UPI001920D127|nr:uncharacterized protein LOC120214103 [Hibiscus syriacus]